MISFNPSNHSSFGYHGPHLKDGKTETFSIDSKSHREGWNSRTQDCLTPETLLFLLLPLRNMSFCPSLLH